MRWLTMSLAGIIACWFSAGVAHSAVRPPGAVTEAAASLHFDVAKIIDLTQQRGWTIDRYEFDKLLPDALLSVCRVSKEARQLALGRTEEALKAAGGPIASLWRREKGLTPRMKRGLTAHRTDALLRRAVALSEAECPVYLKADDSFRGRHRDGASWFISAEGGGAFAVRQTDRLKFGGGGRGRVMLGKGLGGDWSLRAGVELGGAALVDERLKTDDVKFDFIGAVPVALRRQRGIYILDLEAAAIGHGVAGGDLIRYGARVGALVGVSALRIRAILPWTGLLVTGEYVLGRKHMPGQWTIRAGVVVGFNLGL